MIFRFLTAAMVAGLVVGAPLLAAGRAAHDRARAPRVRHDEKDHLVASSAASDRCASLERQLNAALRSASRAAKAEDAKMLRTDGSSLCATGQYAAGIGRLTRGLADLGIAPER